VARRRRSRPVQLQERAIADGEELVVYRIVSTPDREAPAFTDAFRSRSELELPPRAYTPEAATPRVNEGISAFLTFEAAAETAQKFPRLGRFVASVRLVSGEGVTVAEWGARGHLTVFGDAVTLSQAVVDIVPVPDESEAT
jgi:hypothetical protein